MATEVERIVLEFHPLSTSKLKNLYPLRTLFNTAVVHYSSNRVDTKLGTRFLDYDYTEMLA